MVKKVIEDLINQKEKLYEEISFLERKLVDANANVKYDTAEYWLGTDWAKVIEGKATEKIKKAYVDAQIRPLKDKVENLTNEINSLWREVDIINDKIAYGVYDD